MQFPEQFQNMLSHSTEMEDRVLYIEFKTGLTGLLQVFKNADIYDEMDIIYHHIIKNYDIDESDTFLIWNSMQRIFTSQRLATVSANDEEFYYNMDMEEAITVVVRKLLYKKASNSISVNEFPGQFDHVKVNDNKMFI